MALKLTIFSQRVLNVGYDFNNDFYKEIPDLKDLTLKENFHLRAALKIREIIKKTDLVWPKVFSKHDSDAYKLYSSRLAINSHGPIREHYKYNSSGILIQYYRLPLYYKTNQQDSLEANFLTISTDSIKNGFVVNYINRTGCGHKEIYKNNSLIEERSLGCCSYKVGLQNGKDTIKEYVEYKIYKYSKEGKLIEKYSNEIHFEEFVEREKYVYKKNEINRVKVPFHCFNCKVDKYFNKVKFNEYGKIKESRFWPQSDESLALTYYCEYDDKQNLITVLYEFDNDHKKQVLDTYRYTYNEKGYKVEFPASFEMYGGNKIFEFDEVNRIRMISGTERGFTETFEYK